MDQGGAIRCWKEGEPSRKWTPVHQWVKVGNGEVGGAEESEGAEGAPSAATAAHPTYVIISTPTCVTN